MLWQSESLWVSCGTGLIALVMLVLSSDEVVKRLVGLAHYFRLSTTFVGMTVVSLATSIPEISAHMTASGSILTGTLDYHQGSAVVLGANIGSDVVQQTLILGIVVFAAGTLYFERRFLFKSLLPMVGTTLMCLVLGWDQHYSRLDGAILLTTFVLYSYYLYHDDRKVSDGMPRPTESADNAPFTKREVRQYVAIALGAMTVTVLSATIVLHIMENLVAQTGIGGSLIGVITLGVAAALPELMTAFSGIRNKEMGISLGTLIGSNITNPLLAIGGGALLSTYWVPRPLIFWDLPWETITGMILGAILWFRKGKMCRYSAMYLMGLYVIYIVLRAHLFPTDFYI